MRIILTLLVCASVMTAGDVSGRPSDDAIKDAFLRSPEIIQAKTEASADGFDFGDIRIVPFGFLCGAVGCQSSFLVIQELNRKGVNPNSRSLMCLVRIGPKDNITSVERVALVPFSELADKD